jgi:Bacterial alpha-L-rhamnosidase 6 hairpin glycosidase domain
VPESRPGRSCDHPVLRDHPAEAVGATAADSGQPGRALAFGLLPDGPRTQVADDLVVLIRAADTHLGTGFLSTPFLLPVLADVAYELLLRDDEPSWLHMTEVGTTTVWEGFFFYFIATDKHEGNRSQQRGKWSRTHRVPVLLEGVMSVAHSKNSQKSCSSESKRSVSRLGGHVTSSGAEAML